MRIPTSSTFHRTVPQSTLLLRRPQSTVPISRPSTQPTSQSQNETEPEPQSRSQQDIQSKRNAQQARTTIDRQSYEYTNSGTDDAVAAQDTSYTPNTGSTSNPGEAIAQAAEELQQQSQPPVSTAATSTHSQAQAQSQAGVKFNPLEVSPANTAISSTTSEYEGGGSTVVAHGGEHLPNQAPPKTYMGTTTHKSKSKSASVISKTSEKKVFAGKDTRKDVRPGAEQREVEEGKGRGPILRPGPR
ncbi:hypothetical protein G647_05700 [Cladophialophora carrionii CBS 160.54]|uniref:Uncharacterized protein n=1 Tax=Cladophialophora carrionii CBS 160.54 TaxID=1279043 RepID=V9DC71_9EURO|nr:uncharacterized protein G647_05700 [Cladophialophora carrionii CBS 160.54]ETI23893.1 hypothetical protein G647_05700 [Cladophialophora carrionii CBS 160.54]